MRKNARINRFVVELVVLPNLHYSSKKKPSLLCNPCISMIVGMMMILKCIVLLHIQAILLYMAADTKSS
jgi:hypothetical protein